MKDFLLSRMLENPKFKKNIVQHFDKFYYKADSDLTLREDMILHPENDRIRDFTKA